MLCQLLFIELSIWDLFSKPFLSSVFLVKYLFWLLIVAVHQFQCSVVVSGVGLINEVNRHWAQLVLGWVAACGRVNNLGM